MKIIVYILSLSSLFAVDSAVTYEFTGGRFGDNLLSYLHAKWFAFTHDIHVLYKPFPLSRELTLHDRETVYSHDQGRPRRHVGQWFDSQKPFLYICPYFPEDKQERVEYFSFDVDWNNNDFRALCLEAIAPKRHFQLTPPLENAINIAIHVREGGGFDQYDMKEKYPTKFPPMKFYREALTEVLKLLPKKPIYCHVFTDARVPALIVDSIKVGLTSTTDITFGCRQGYNQHDRNVLEDFFSLFAFDILIRPQSNFSIIPSLLHDFAIVHTPAGTEINETLYRSLFK